MKEKLKLLWSGPTPLTGRYMANYYPYSLWVGKKWWFIYGFEVYERGTLVAKGYAITQKIAMRMAEKARLNHIDLKTR